MVVSSIVKLDKKKSKIVFDDESYLALYNGEIYRFGISEGKDIGKDTYSAIYNILKKRARERSLFLLKDSDKTIKQVRDKLKSGFYPKDIIDETIDFLCRYNYLDDKRYCKLYIKSRMSSKSIRQIKADLFTKGINQDIINSVLEQDEELEFDNDTLMTKLLQKKKYDPAIDDYSYKNKILSYLVRKGFDYNEAISAMNKFK